MYCYNHILLLHRVCVASIACIHIWWSGIEGEQFVGDQESFSWQLSPCGVSDESVFIRTIILVSDYVMNIYLLCNKHGDDTIWDLSTRVCDCFWGAHASFMHPISFLKFGCDSYRLLSLVHSDSISLLDPVWQHHHRPPMLIGPPSFPLLSLSLPIMHVSIFIIGALLP